MKRSSAEASFTSRPTWQTGDPQMKGSKDAGRVEVVVCVCVVGMWWIEVGRRAAAEWQGRLQRHSLHWYRRLVVSAGNMGEGEGRQDASPGPTSRLRTATSRPSSGLLHQTLRWRVC